MMLDRNASKKREHRPNEPVLGFYTKKQVTCPVQFGLKNPKLASDLKSDLLSYDDIPTTSQFVTNGQSSCKSVLTRTTITDKYNK